MTTSPNVVAVYNLDDDTLRLSCPGLDRFPSDLLAQAKTSGFRHWRSSKQLVGTWTPEREDFALAHAPDIQDTVLKDDPSARIDRFQRYSRGAAQRASERGAAAHAVLPDGGEPVKLDHHSARRHLRAIERSDRLMQASLAEQSKAEYWAERAQAAEAHARMKSDPQTVRNRVKALEAELRAWRRREGHADEAVRHKAGRWTAHLTIRIAYEQARLAVLEPAPPPRPSYVKGEQVWWRKFGLCEIVSVGPKNCQVKILRGGATGTVLRAGRDELTLPR